MATSSPVWLFSVPFSFTVEQFLFSLYVICKWSCGGGGGEENEREFLCKRGEVFRYKVSGDMNR